MLGAARMGQFESRVKATPVQRRRSINHRKKRSGAWLRRTSLAVGSDHVDRHADNKLAPPMSFEDKWRMINTGRVGRECVVELERHRFDSVVGQGSLQPAIMVDVHTVKPRTHTQMSVVVPRHPQGGVGDGEGGLAQSKARPRLRSCWLAART